MDVKVFVRANLDRVVGWGLIGVGGLALVLGWLGVSRTPLPSEQIPYLISGGLTGLALIGVGATLLLSAVLTDEWRKLDEIRDHLREGIGAGVNVDRLPANGQGETGSHDRSTRARPSALDSSALERSGTAPS